MYAWEFAELLSISERNGWARMVAMQDHYNLLAREEEREMHPLCEYAGVGVIPWSPLARGHLAGTRNAVGDASNETTARPDRRSRSTPLHGAERCGDHRCRACGRSTTRSARWPRSRSPGWSKPVVTAPIIGVTKMPQLDERSLRSTSSSRRRHRRDGSSVPAAPSDGTRPPAHCDRWRGGSDPPRYAFVTIVRPG